MPLFPVYSRGREMQRNERSEVLARLCQQRTHLGGTSCLLSPCLFLEVSFRPL